MKTFVEQLAEQYMGLGFRCSGFWGWPELEKRMTLDELKAMSPVDRNNALCELDKSQLLDLIDELCMESRTITEQWAKLFETRGRHGIAIEDEA